MNNFNDLLITYKVAIPPIQRDYAQGRNSNAINTIRERFLQSVFEALNVEDGQPLLLDFIYGYIEEDTLAGGNQNLQIFKPLDGQQRLTTLFLLHWYIANRENNLNSASSILQRFTYETRRTSREFCEKLVNFNLNLNLQSPVDKQIVNQPWYFSNWNNDPTIQSMLVVLASIEVKYNYYSSLPNTGLSNVWQNLISPQPKIQFELLSMKELGLADDLYIKMNARGKALTAFEQFKSYFSTILNSEHSKYFNNKIDNEWTDLFWAIFKDREDIDLAKFVDQGFLNFFNYVTDILIIKGNIEIQRPDFLLKEENVGINIQEIINNANYVYKGNSENVKLLFDWLDLFERLSHLDWPFDEIFYLNDVDFRLEKTKLFGTNTSLNLFNNCVEYYGKANFPLMEHLLLYTFIQIKINNIEVPENFYRLVRNLLANTSDNQFRFENLSALYRGIDNLILGDREFSNLPFTRRQLNEEIEKENFLNQNNGIKEIIYRLEDHSLLKGSISIFNIDETIELIGPIFLRKFTSTANLLAINKSLLTKGMYPQIYNGASGIKKRFGNARYNNWEEIFTHSENRQGFDNVKEILRDYLNFCYENVTSDEEIVNHYLLNGPAKDITYYILTYDSFISHNGTTFKGFYSWTDIENEPYKCYILSGDNFRSKSWSPFLYELNLRCNDCILEDSSSDLLFTRGDLSFIIKHENAGFKFIAAENNLIAETIIDNLTEINKLNQEGVLLINQDYAGIDLEDRILKCLTFINEEIILAE